MFGDAMSQRAYSVYTVSNSVMYALLCHYRRSLRQSLMLRMGPMHASSPSLLLFSWVAARERSPCLHAFGSGEQAMFTDLVEANGLAHGSHM